MSTDLLGHELTATETELLAVHDALRALLAADDLPPCAAAGVRAALAPLAVVVTDLALRFDHLLDDGV
jgi:2-C-methyl-D-erythritol 4-phosphate cytidylyltransferase